MFYELLKAYTEAIYMTHLTFYPAADAEQREGFEARLNEALKTIREWPGLIEEDYYVREAFKSLQGQGVVFTDDTIARDTEKFNSFFESDD